MELFVFLLSLCCFNVKIRSICMQYFLCVKVNWAKPFGYQVKRALATSVRTEHLHRLVKGLFYIFTPLRKTNATAQQSWGSWRKETKMRKHQRCSFFSNTAIWGLRLVLQMKCARYRCHIRSRAPWVICTRGAPKPSHWASSNMIQQSVPDSLMAAALHTDHIERERGREERDVAGYVSTRAINHWHSSTL